MNEDRGARGRFVRNKMALPPGHDRPHEGIGVGGAIWLVGSMIAVIALAWFLIG
jgi:hypothetical protein